MHRGDRAVAAARLDRRQRHQRGRRHGRRGRRRTSTASAICRTAQSTATTPSGRRHFAVKGLLTADGIRFMFTSFVPNFLGFAAVGRDPGGDDRRRRRGATPGWSAALIRKLVAISTAGLADVHHRLRRHRLQRRRRRGLPRADPARGGRLPQRRTTSARGHRRRLRRGQRRVRRQHPDRRRPTASSPTSPTRRRARRPGGPDLDLVANLFFGIGSTLFLTVVIALVTTRIVEPRLGTWDRSRRPTRRSWRARRGRPIDAAARGQGPALGRARRRWRCWRSWSCSDAAVGRAAAQPRDRRHHRRLAVHEQPDRDHLARLPGRRAGVRARGRDDQEQRATRSG